MVRRETGFVWGDDVVLWCVEVGGLVCAVMSERMKEWGSEAIYMEKGSNENGIADSLKGML